MRDPNSFGFRPSGTHPKKLSDFGIEYARPDSGISVEIFDEVHRPFMTVVRKSVCSRTGKKTSICQDVRLEMSLIKDPRHFAHFVMSAIRGFEIHEIREWFKLNGELLDDPHA